MFYRDKKSVEVSSIHVPNMAGDTKPISIQKEGVDRLPLIKNLSEGSSVHDNQMTLFPELTPTDGQSGGRTRRASPTGAVLNLKFKSYEIPNTLSPSKT